MAENTPIDVGVDVAKPRVNAPSPAEEPGRRWFVCVGGALGLAAALAIVWLAPARKSPARPASPVRSASVNRA